MYIIIRVIIGCIFFACTALAIRKSKVMRKRMLYAVFAGVSVLLIAVSALLPVENLFVTFDSPKSAYAYMCAGESNIALVVEGDDCDFVVDRKNDGDTYLMIPKTVEGWKIGTGASTRRVVEKLADGIVIYVYQYKDTADYFITVFDTNGGELTLSDAQNTKFYSLQQTNDFLEQTYTTYYAHIPSINPQYSVTVNGYDILLEQ